MGIHSEALADTVRISSLNPRRSFTVVNTVSVPDNRREGNSRA
jgi:hypothetical protein